LARSPTTGERHLARIAGAHLTSVKHGKSMKAMAVAVFQFQDGCSRTQVATDTYGLAILGVHIRGLTGLRQTDIAAERILDTTQWGPVRAKRVG